MYVDIVSGLIIAASIVWVGLRISKDLVNLRHTLSIGTHRLSDAVQEQTEALVGTEEDLDIEDEDEGEVPVNS